MVTPRKTKRRMIHTKYNRRKFNRREQEFYYLRSIHLGDTQAMGGTVYYAQYWDLVGEAREEFLIYALGENRASFFSSGIALVTVDCKGKYLKPLNAYDKIKIVVKVQKLTRVKLYLTFEIVDVNRKHTNFDQMLNFFA